MKIVIDRDKEVNKLKEMLDTLTDKKDLQSVRFAINILENIDGIPLPEHYGRLIDADALKSKIMYAEDKAYETWDELYDSVLEDIDNASIIIEADKGSDSE